MPVRGPLFRLLSWVGALGAGALAVVGGLGLQGPGLVAVGIAGTLAACTAAGIARDLPRHDRRTVAESAVQAGGWTIGLLLVLAGLATVAGGFVALLALVVGVTVWLGLRAMRSAAGTAGPAPAPGSRPGPAAGAEVFRLPVPPSGTSPAPGSSPIAELSTPALGREWLRSTRALSGRLAPVERQALVRRRQETLDELERRDPAGFARWLAEGPVPGSDPAAYVHARSVHGDPAADTDAA
ncbi:hypothetical protein [Blastococcus haudaquaticus]|uniref:Uncharacterized protein n=1 Tax=Blastococcus haudaquaticus TaxID=1938745 RepID=A0A286GZ44_9ACTN|nr:hypothetical protein [Blastococcus haudaquaticus]SOE00805.1 hypothetical protein SAMN06272739_2795 [Blastococcus haudaquaticus]